jgi:hypothetical protein
MLGDLILIAVEALSEIDLRSLAVGEKSDAARENSGVKCVGNVDEMTSRNYRADTSFALHPSAAPRTGQVR